MSEKHAVVLVSGGLDSATCLFFAQEQGYDSIALSFDYGQRHRAELIAAAAIAEHARVEHKIIAVDLRAIGSSALTADIAVPKGGAELGATDKIPVTYVPVRNMIFLSLAYAFAEARQAQAIFIGVNAIDYSGYPDCRPDFIESFAETARLASKIGREGKPIELKTPLVLLSKADIAREALRLKVPLASTWSCYDPQKETNHSVRPCEKCDACILRHDGFSQLHVTLSREEIFGAPRKVS